VAELNLDLTEVLKPVLGEEKTRSDCIEKNLKLENNFENSFSNEKISEKNLNLKNNIENCIKSEKDIVKFSELKIQKNIWHPVPKLMLNNGSRVRDVNFERFFEILEKFFINNLEVIVTLAKDLSSKNSYEFRRLNIELYVLGDWLEPAPRLYNLVCIYYGEKISNSLPSIPFDEDTLSYPFWTDLETTQGVSILKIVNMNEINLQKNLLPIRNSNFC
jgi:hypothetical protein